MPRLCSFASHHLPAIYRIDIARVVDWKQRCLVVVTHRPTFYPTPLSNLPNASKIVGKHTVPGIFWPLFMMAFFIMSFQVTIAMMTCHPKPPGNVGFLFCGSAVSMMGPRLGRCFEKNVFVEFSMNI